MKPALPRVVKIDARAKLNLGLAVGPRRPDGFHELATFFQSISLADTLVARPARRGFTLRVRHESAAVRGDRGKSSRRLVPSGPTNLVLRAARRFAEATGLERGARFTLVKRIPARAGLGGGSADAAAALRALVRLHGVRMSRESLIEIAASLGSDVPFALFGGTALGLGRGERLHRLVLAQPFRAIVAVPSWRISTAQAFALIDRRNYSLTAWKAKLRSAQILGRERLSTTSAMRLGNTFEEALGRRRPQFLSLVARLSEAGATNIRMTGSGSAVFGVLEPGLSAKKVVDRFEGRETLFLVRATRAGCAEVT